MDPHDDPLTRLRALRTVEATHEGGSAAVAAQTLHCSTSTVSRTIQQTEQALRVALFERGTRAWCARPPGWRWCAAARPCAPSWC